MTEYRGFDEEESVICTFGNEHLTRLTLISL